MSATRFDLASATRAGADERLHEWVADFLASPGSDNEILAAALAQRPLWWHGPVQLALADLVPLAGPEDDEGETPTEDVIVPVAPDEWEADVGEMVEALEEGWEPPPLIVSSRAGRLFLEDGNHRHETLDRAGASHAWVIVAFESPEE